MQIQDVSIKEVSKMLKVDESVIQECVNFFTPFGKQSVDFIFEIEEFCYKTFPNKHDFFVASFLMAGMHEQYLMLLTAMQRSDQPKSPPGLEELLKTKTNMDG